MSRELLRRVWQGIQRLLLTVAGAFVAAVGYSIFQVPYNIAAGGVSGIAIIVNAFTGWPVGAFYLALNIPLLILGFFQLGRWRFLLQTLLAVAIFSTATDLLPIFLPALVAVYPLTDNILLSAIYAGLVVGVGEGLVYRAGATIGGTSILGRVLQLRTGIPLSQIYLYTDGAIVLGAGLVFGWEVALYAMLTLFLSGLASDYTLEGPSSVRTATIVTDHPQEVTAALMEQLGRGVSYWEIRGGYRGDPHTMLTCTVYRPQVNDLRTAVAMADPEAFVVIGQAHQALGKGFRPLSR